MKAIKATPFLLALVPFIASCDGDVKASDILDSGKEALSNLEDLDLSKLSVDDMKEKVGELTSSLGSKLEGIKDEAGAIDVAKSLGPVVDQLNNLKGVLGDNMPTMDQLGGIVDSLKSKFSGDEGIMKALQPLLEKLQSLLG